MIELTRSIACVFVGFIGDVRRVIIGSYIDFLFERISSEVFSLMIAVLDEMVTCGFLDTISGSIDVVGCSRSS